MAPRKKPKGRKAKDDPNARDPEIYVTDSGSESDSDSEQSSSSEVNLI